jgi:hypothetical protein
MAGGEQVVSPSCGFDLDVTIDQIRFLPPKLLRYTPHVSVKLTLLDSGALKGRTKAPWTQHTEQDGTVTAEPSSGATLTHVLKDD